ncbi:hypothetical protein BHM03_00034391 [Ensete ventricosum]|nr:hypothetical protein BHM03_00034391 [Ensete ventricosum]
MLDGCPIVSCSSCPTLVVPPLNSQDHSKIFLWYISKLFFILLSLDYLYDLVVH